MHVLRSVQIIEQYRAGASREKLAKKFGIGVRYVSNILSAAGLLSHKRIDREQRNRKIAEQYLSGMSKKDISKAHGLTMACVGCLLHRQGITKKQASLKKGGFTNEQKAEIIRLYTEEHRGRMYIGKLFNRCDNTILFWLSKWQVKPVSRSKICERIRDVYGPTLGFSGHTHKRSSRIQISKSGKDCWQRGDREVTIGKSRTYLTVVGKVLGTFEVAYLQQRRENGLPVPSLCHKRYKTPYGTYKPDFQFAGGPAIEVKSKFTLAIAKGLMPFRKGVFSDTQFKKIVYFQKNIGPLNIEVIESNEAARLFKRASLPGGVLDLTSDTKIP